MPTHRHHHKNHLTTRGHVNTEVMDLYRDGDTPFIETTIVIRTPVTGTPAERLMLSQPDNISKYLDTLNQRVQEDVGQTFESDVLRVSSQLHHYLRLGAKPSTRPDEASS